MLSLFENGTPRSLAKYLTDKHAVEEARVAGIPWGNGELRSAAANPSFQILFGIDKNLRYQQNLSGRRSPSLCLAKADGGPSTCTQQQ
jgi:hypothetical protein